MATPSGRFEQVALHSMFPNVFVDAGERSAQVASVGISVSVVARKFAVLGTLTRGLSGRESSSAAGDQSRRYVYSSVLRVLNLFSYSQKSKELPRMLHTSTVPFVGFFITRWHGHLGPGTPGS